MEENQFSYSSNQKLTCPTRISSDISNDIHGRISMPRWWENTFSQSL